MLVYSNAILCLCLLLLAVFWGIFCFYIWQNFKQTKTAIASIELLKNIYAAAYNQHILKKCDECDKSFSTIAVEYANNTTIENTKLKKQIDLLKEEISKFKKEQESNTYVSMQLLELKVHIGLIIDDYNTCLRDNIIIPDNKEEVKQFYDIIEIIIDKLKDQIPNDKVRLNPYMNNIPKKQKHKQTWDDVVNPDNKNILL